MTSIDGGRVSPPVKLIFRRSRLPCKNPPQKRLFYSKRPETSGVQYGSQIPYVEWRRSAPSGRVEAADQDAPVAVSSWTAPSRILSRTVLRLGLVALLALPVGTFAAWKLTSKSPPEPQAEIDFSSDIQPILATRCFACHGPDGSKRRAELRLDTKEGLLGGAGKTGVVIPGKPDESELFRRITADSADERMPPAESAKPLSESERALFRHWIEQGGKWQGHW